MTSNPASNASFPVCCTFALKLNVRVTGPLTVVFPINPWSAVKNTEALLLFTSVFVVPIVTSFTPNVSSVEKMPVPKVT